MMNDYEMKNEDLNEVLICQLCQNTFNEPVKLPCYNSVCENHINSSNEKFQCKLCNSEHLIPFKGFNKNIELKLLIQMHTQNNQNSKTTQNYGKNNIKAKELCDNIENILQKARFVSSHPLDYINEYFSNIRVNMDLERERITQQINDNYFKLLEELLEKEQKCIASLDNSGIVNLNQVIDSINIKLENWSKKCSDPNINDNKEWNNLRLTIEHETKRVEYSLERLKNELMLNKDYKFEAKPTVDNNSFGSLYVLQKEIQNEDKLHECIHFEIKNFKSFLNDKLDRYYDRWCVLDNKPWSIIFEIENDLHENYELLFAAYLKADCNDEILVENPVKVNITYKLLDIKGNVFKKVTDDYVYDGTKKATGSNIATIKEIMKNKIYSKKNDSIKIEIDMELVNHFKS